jgi:hypothetical protein
MNYQQSMRHAGLDADQEIQKTYREDTMNPSRRAARKAIASDNQDRTNRAWAAFELARQNVRQRTG